MRPNRSRARIAESGTDPPGRSRSRSTPASQVAVTVEDNGKGLPQQGRERLTEPYVTTRAKGTGLGLAIVKKIMEDHRGELDAGRRRREWRPGEAGLSPPRLATAVPPVRTRSTAELSSVTHGA